MIGLIGVSSAGAGGQAPAGKGSPADPLTVCEILKNPLRYDGQIVTIRDHVTATDEGGWLNGRECPGVFSTDGYAWPSIIVLWDGVWPWPLHSPDFSRDMESERRTGAKWMLLKKVVPDRCLVAMYTGLFETRTDWSAAKRVYPNGTTKFLGFGHLDAAPGELLVRSADDVEVDPRCGQRMARKGMRALQRQMD